MRTAALGFAFESLGATAAISSATLANGASLGVSRRVGYLENGRSRIVDTGGDVATLQHFRLTAGRWTSPEVSVTGFVTALARPAAGKWNGMKTVSGRIPRVTRTGALALPRAEVTVTSSPSSTPTWAASRGCISTKGPGDAAARSGLCPRAIVSASKSLASWS